MNVKKDTKKIFFYNDSGNIVESFEVAKESEVESAKVLVVTEIPEYTPKNGFCGKMIVKDDKLDYAYTPVDPDEDLTPEQLVQVFEEVM